MYYYKIYDNKKHYTITHVNKFSQEELLNIYNQSDVINKILNPYDEVIDTIEYMYRHYGFKPLSQNIGYECEIDVSE